MKVNFIELLTILQLIIIRNWFDGKNIKSQAIKRLFNYRKEIGFCILNSRKFSSEFCFWSSSATLKIIHSGTWLKKVVHPWYRPTQRAPE